MANEKVVAKQISLKKLLTEVANNTRKIPANVCMDMLFKAVEENEAKNDNFKDLVGNPKYESVIGQLIFTVAMLITSYTLPKKEMEKVIARCDEDTDKMN